MGTGCTKTVSPMQSIKDASEKPLDAFLTAFWTRSPPLISSLNFHAEIPPDTGHLQRRHPHCFGRHEKNNRRRSRNTQSTMAASSDAGYLMSDAPSRPAGTPRGGALGFPSSSSARPRGPPSESLGAASDIDEDGFADDQVPRRSRKPDATNVPPVEDQVGKMAQRSFEDFLEK